MLSCAIVSDQPYGKCQTLTYIKSCGYVGLSGCYSAQYLADSYPFVCAVLALDSWNYCSGEQDPTVKHALLNVYPNGFIE